MTITEWRQATASFGKEISKSSLVSFEDRTIPARDGFPLSCRLFNDHLSSDSPVFVFFPGCAFLFDFFEVNSAITSQIAEKVDVKVILVQFRLAPEYSILTSLSDSYDAVRYIALQPEFFGIDPQKISIGGWCSGAHAATYASKVANETNEFCIQHQIFLGGSFDLSHSFHEFDEYEAQDPSVSRKLIAQLAHQFYSMDCDRNPLYSPYWDDNLRKLPQTTIICGEYDALRNDSEAYFRKLKALNVEVDRIVLDGQSHNSVVMQNPKSTGCGPVDVIANALRNRS